MTKRTRLIILLICVVLFLIIAPYIVLYSLGYRVDFKNAKIVATGGIYVKVQPTGSDVTINSTIKNTTGYFYNSVFVQNLLPGPHHILIQKPGYHDYYKELQVTQNTVTKLENVILFKNNIAFESTSNINQFDLLTKKPAEQFVIRNNNLYYADIPENAALAPLQKTTPLIENLLAYEATGDNILWLHTTGLLYNFNLTTQTSEPISHEPFKTDTKKKYDLKILSERIFLKENDKALLFDPIQKKFEDFHSIVNDFKISPDGQIIAYYGARQVLYSPISDLSEKILLHTSGAIIKELFWINNDYILFLAGNEIIISEIDTRGNINTINLFVTIPNQTEALDIKDAQVFFNQQDKKLYILTEDILIISERLIP